MLPDDPQLATCLAHLYAETARHEEAIEWTSRLIERGIETGELVNIRGYAYLGQHNLKAALEDFILAFQLEPDRWATLSNLLLTLHYMDDLTAREIFAVHREFGSLMEARVGSGMNRWTNEKNPDRRLRIGFVSPDLRAHSVAYFLEPLLEHLPREQFQAFCYSTVKLPDGVTRRLREKADHWRNLLHRSSQDMAEEVLKDEIDILIDLAGHTGDGPLELFGRKPAPIQATWLGYPDTTGLKTIDYRIVDALTDPPGESDDLATESLVRLREGFLCYRIPEGTPEVSALPATEAGAVTFGCFNNQDKVSPATLSLWAAILHALPQSRLLLKNKNLDDPMVCEGVRRKFSDAGIPSERLRLHGRNDRITEHLAMYHQVDIALDTYPYHGTTTTLEALTMGVPVVTLAGNTHAARVGVSILTHLGAEDLIAQTPQQVLEICAALAQDLPLLAEIRATLRDRLLASPLTNGPGFAERMGKALHEMWKAYCSNTE
jgi:predicted O-linked N-acetylglucosamine transferase (SPINDLY family)